MLICTWGCGSLERDVSKELAEVHTEGVNEGLAEAKNFNITLKSIGPIKLCQNLKDVKLPFISDTTSGGDGFFFFGKYFGYPDNEILVDISGFDSLHLAGFSTRSKVFHTANDIGVGSTLSDLLSSNGDIEFTSVIVEYSDFYFFEQDDFSRIEYRLNIESELVKSKIYIADSRYKIKDVEGMTELVQRIGNEVQIEQISVVRLNAFSD